MIWGTLQESPLIHQLDSFDPVIDIALCKIAARPDGTTHQALSFSLAPLTGGEYACAFGYADTKKDIPFSIVEGRLVLEQESLDLYVSFGKVINVFPENNQKEKQASTPGPCLVADQRAEMHGPARAARTSHFSRLESRLICPACASRRVTVLFELPSAMRRWGVGDEESDRQEKGGQLGRPSPSRWCRLGSHFG
jgi:hypothetical protein